MIPMVQFLPGLAVLIIEAALQISGYQNPHLALVFFAIAAVLLLIPAWLHLKRLYPSYRLQWPIARVPANAPLATRAEANRERLHQGLSTPSEQGKSPPKKYYSKEDKERLSNFYGELSQLLLSNGANGTGDGVYGAATALGNDWNRQIGTNPGKLDVARLNTEAQALQLSMRNFYNALYGENPIPKKAQYLPYTDELRVVLRDDKGTRPIELLSTAAASFNVALEAVEKANDDPRMVEVIVRLSTPRVTDFHNTTSAFQGWEFEANQRAQAARKALTE